MTPRTLLVTGCSRGIGLAVTQRLLDEGHEVIGISRQAPDIGHAQFSHVRLDLSALAALPEQLGGIAKTRPEIDGLVLNAGMGRFGALEQFSVAQVQQLIDLNLTSQVLIAREFLPKLKRHGAGDLLFIGSEAALRGGRNGAIYSATKFALRGLAQALQQECASSGVRVGIINPGMVNTSFYDELNFQPGEEPDQHLEAGDVADAVMLILNARPGAVMQEINLQPQKRVIRFD
jgi:3-hydroxy acid dehydrogenase / malonic semialdehyde reductase